MSGVKQSHSIILVLGWRRVSIWPNEYASYPIGIHGPETKILDHVTITVTFINNHKIALIYNELFLW